MRVFFVFCVDDEELLLLQDPKLDAKKKPYEQVPKDSEGSRMSVM